jgi:translation initiation factor 4G
MKVCKEKPDNLVLTDVIGNPAADASMTPQVMDRTASGGRGRGRSHPMPPPSNVPNRQGVGLGIPMNQKGGGFQMGQFGTVRHVTGPVGNQFQGGKPGLIRTASQGGGAGGVGVNQPSGLGSNRHRGSRQGKHRTEANRVHSQHGTPLSGQAQLPLEPVAPLEMSANRWTPASIAAPGAGFARRPGQPVDENSPEVVDRKVKSLLNRLSMEKFDSLSDQIIEWANKSEKENDGRTLMRVIRHVFEKATDEAAWSEMYARLCRKMLEKISNNVVDESIKTSDGNPFAGGQLFRKYLLNRCQEDFERGWQLKEVAMANAANKATDDDKAAAAETEGEEALYSDEYYALQKAKRQGLGLVKFIGELFKLQMLTERIMHECIKKLLSNVDNPAEEEIESLCKLLTTIGQQLDTQKASKHMDVYFTRMKELSSSPKIASRMQFMLQVGCNFC